MTIEIKPTARERALSLGGAAVALALTTEMMRQCYVYATQGGAAAEAKLIAELGRTCASLRERVYELALAEYEHDHE
jgi:hypothetical protein